jgi:hypothetical protein
MQFAVRVDKDGMIRETKGSKLTLKALDGTQGSGKMGQSPAHQLNSDMHNAHLIADRFRGSGYREAHNLVTTSSYYNLNVMSKSEMEIAKFVEEHDERAKFDLKIAVDWEKFDPGKATRAILQQMQQMPAWQDKDRPAEDMRNIFEKYFWKFNSQLYRVLRLQYDVTVYPRGKAPVDMQPIKCGPDIHLGL